MPTVWFMIVSVMIAAYVVLDGFDLGAGIIYLARRMSVARSCAPSGRCGMETKYGCSLRVGHCILPTRNSTRRRSAAFIFR